MKPSLPHWLLRAAALMVLAAWSAIALHTLGHHAFGHGHLHGDGHAHGEAHAHGDGHDHAPASTKAEWHADGHGHSAVAAACAVCEFFLGVAAPLAVAVALAGVAAWIPLPSHPARVGARRPVFRPGRAPPLLQAV